MNTSDRTTGSLQQQETYEQQTNNRTTGSLQTTETTRSLQTAEQQQQQQDSYEQHLCYLNCIVIFCLLFVHVFAIFCLTFVLCSDNNIICISLEY
jgi:t-SNARE complex subunit (syntaxin)